MSYFSLFRLTGDVCGVSWFLIAKPASYSRSVNCQMILLRVSHHRELDQVSTIAKEEGLAGHPETSTVTIRRRDLRCFC